MNYLLQTKPFLIPADGGKTIEEHFGNVATNTQAYSIARMVAPPGWIEPFQNPEFDELTLMVSGKKRIDVDCKTLDLEAGQSLLIKKGARVRYSNPFSEPAVYWSVCIPGFTLETVHREE